ncbi:60S ribosomal export protein NMD3, partial [Smittium culicis]
DEIGTVLSSNSLKEFYVIDVEPVQSNKTLGKFALADITVQRLSDVGKNNNEYIVRSHLGNLLNYGDTVLGYDLEISNINNKFFERLSSEKIPSIVLVKKSYSEKKRKRKQRNWKLKSLTKDEGELQAKKQAQKKIDDDYELFLRDLEEDPELRQNINLYKSDNPHRQADSIETDGGYIVSDGESELDDEDLPEVPLEELLDGLNLNENDGQEVEIDDEY